MATKRTYGDLCGIARALDVVGERWALLVVRELLLGPKRFTDLQAGLPNVSPDVLAQRLRELEQAGVIRRGKLPPPAAARVYELTKRGQEVEPVILALGRWGSTVPSPGAGARIGADSLVLGLKTLFDPAVDGDLTATIELRLPEQPFRAHVSERRLDLARSPADRPTATIAADPGVLATILWQGRSLDDARAEGVIEVEGDLDSLRRFLTLFPLPEPSAEDVGHDSGERIAKAIQPPSTAYSSPR